MFKDLHEGILLEFAERAARSVEPDIKAGLMSLTRKPEWLKVDSKDRSTKKALRMRRKLAGLCVACGKEAVKARTRCVGCAVRHHASDRERKAAA